MNQKLNIFQVDAFAEKVFEGNPAAVIPLEEWPDEKLMQKIAMENNLAETAFYVKREKIFEIRWFTPLVEVDLCGHATLAAAFVIFNFSDHNGDLIHFFSHRSGELKVARKDDLLTLDFPTDSIAEIPITDDLEKCFQLLPKKALKGKTDYLLVFDSENEIRELTPNIYQISRLPVRGLIVTAKGDKVDFVSRFFAPQSGIDEDPVTGSAHTSLTPFWSKQLGKTELSAEQLSSRTGKLFCVNKGERTYISGKAILYMKGEIFI